MTSVLVQLSSQVCASMAELAAMLADAIAASLPSKTVSGRTHSGVLLSTGQHNQM